MEFQNKFVRLNNFKIVENYFSAFTLSSLNKIFNSLTIYFSITLNKPFEALLRETR